MGPHSTPGLPEESLKLQVNFSSLRRKKISITFSFLICKMKMSRVLIQQKDWHVNALKY